MYSFETADDLVSMFDPDTGMGVAAVYRAQGQDPDVPVTVIPSLGDELDDNKQQVAQGPVFLLLRDQIPGDEPLERDTITIGGDVYQVVGAAEAEPPDRAVWKVTAAAL